MNKYERMVQDKKLEKTVFRVGAYCRVSTDKNDQLNSFESQRRYFKEYIDRTPKWELADVFADEGKSGTNTKKRTAFNRMIACAKNGELDLIITKEISRFARNTLDSIYYTRELKRIGVGVIFLNDNINTLDPDAELRLTIMSSIAQEESRKTSDRVKWGQKRRMEQGVVFGTDMLGYDVRGGEMFLNEDGAKIVRLIFHKFVNEEKGTHVIARELREDGIASYKKKLIWSAAAILRIIRNEKYCGDLVQKKTFTPDYLTHEKKYNRGEEEFVILKDHHEPIISREMFNRANEILESRAVSPEGKAKHSNRYAFSGKIKCACCNSSYVARYKTRKDNTQHKLWRCFKAVQYGNPRIDKTGNPVGCSNDSIRNLDAAYIMGLVVSRLDFDKDMIIRNLLGVIKNVLTTDNPHFQIESLEAKLTDLDAQQKRLIEIYMNAMITCDEFVEARNKCGMEIQQTRELIENAKKQNMLVKCQQTLIRDIEDTLREMIGGTCNDDVFLRNILNRMLIYNRDRIDVYLNYLPHQWGYVIKTASRFVFPTDKR